MKRTDYFTDVLGKKARSTEEEDMQIALCELLKINARKDVIWYAVPNGGHRSKKTAGRLKAMGVKKGVYDLAGVLPDAAAWFLELKVGDNKPTKEQKEFGEVCERLGVPHHVAYSLDSAVEFLVNIGVMKPTKL